jgi:uncharacterized damage-inducible protein DinB
MAIKDALLPEYDHEMGTTRRVLERVPDADLGWKPHEKSYSMGQLAMHLANLPTWVGITLDNAILDLATIGEDARPREPSAPADVLTHFDNTARTARKRLDEATDAMLIGPFTLKQGSHEIFTMPKIAVLRSFVMNHSIHHRGQLSVYLRLRNVPLPAMYGPTADEG